MYQVTKSILSLVFLLLLAHNSSLITPVSAHVLESNGSVGAVMHINPNDEPIALEQAGFFFEFKDKQNKFTPQKCDCQFYIFERGTQIYAQPLFQDNKNPSLSNASVQYIFPRKDIYEVRVVGTPLSQTDFQPFTLKYNIRIDKETVLTDSNSPSSNWFATHYIHIVGIGLIILFFIGALVKQYLKKSGNMIGSKGNGRA